jgi:hypothetical protein
MAKTPFEIRLDLLQMANGILSDKNWAERNRIENDWSTQRDIAMKSETINIPPAPIVPSVNEDEIITLAKKLNEFVSNG